MNSQTGLQAIAVLAMGHKKNLFPFSWGSVLNWTQDAKQSIQPNKLWASIALVVTGVDYSEGEKVGVDQAKGEEVGGEAKSKMGLD
jgi:hypothetical protein